MPVSTHIHGLPVALVYQQLATCFSILDRYREDQQADPQGSPFRVQRANTLDEANMCYFDRPEDRLADTWQCCSVGSGLARDEYALLLHHQAHPQRSRRLCFRLIDPDPTAWQSLDSVAHTKPMRYPALMPMHATVDQVNDPRERTRYRDVLLLNYCDTRPYDLEAVAHLKPHFVIAIADLYGNSHSSVLHELIASAGGPQYFREQETVEMEKAKTVIASLSAANIAYRHLHTSQKVWRVRNNAQLDGALVQRNGLLVLGLRGLLNKLLTATSSPLEVHSSGDLMEFTSLMKCAKAFTASDSAANQARFRYIAACLAFMRASQSDDPLCADWPCAKLSAHNLRYHEAYKQAHPEQAAAEEQYWKKAGLLS